MRVGRAAALLVVVVAACASPDTTPGGDGGGGGGSPVDAYMDEYGGSRAVYTDILSESDCAALQDAFDQASTNNYATEPGTDAFSWTTGYMAAADDRMREVGCY